MASKKYRSTLGDYFTLQRGTTYKSRLLDQPGPILLGLATIQRNGGFRLDSLRTYGGESPDALLVQPGELYVSLKDVTQSADLLGAVAKLPLDRYAGRLTQDTVKLQPIGDEVPTDYLYWLLRTPQYRGYCRAHATGTTNLGLAREDFLAFPAPEPTTSQRNIAHILNTLDDKIELNRRMNETLEEMARAIFKSWFVDFDPVRAKAEGRDPGLPKHIADLFPDHFENSELGEIPAEWKIGTLGEHFDAVKGVSYKGSGLADVGTPLHNLNSIYEGGGYKYKGIKYYNGDFAAALLDLHNEKVIVVVSPRVDDDIRQYVAAANIWKVSEMFDLVPIPVVLDIHMPALKLSLDVDSKVVRYRSLAGIDA